MTKEELIDLLYDDAFQDAAHSFVEYMATAALGYEEELKKVYNSNTNKCEVDYREVKLMEVLVSIKNALWTIADNM